MGIAKKHKAWYPDIFFSRSFANDIKTRCLVSITISDEQMAKIKANAYRTMPKSANKVLLSGNDAVTAWIANAVNACGFSYACNLRGKLPNLPLKVNANAEGVWMVGNANRVGLLRSHLGAPIHAVDVRESVTSNGNVSGPSMWQLRHARMYAFTNWTKIQHIPTFGATNKLHVAVSPVEAQRFLMLTDFGLIYKIGETTSLAW